jgi:hypothetical protein
MSPAKDKDRCDRAPQLSQRLVFAGGSSRQPLLICSQLPDGGEIQTAETVEPELADAQRRPAHAQPLVRHRLRWRATDA